MKNANPPQVEGHRQESSAVEYRFERALTIVVPCLNEAAAISGVIDGLAQVATDCLDRFEIVAINDGSTDDTGAILERLKDRIPQLIVVHHAQRQGVGAGFQAALRLATAPFITVVPGDGAYPPENLRAAFELVGSARHIGSTRVNQSSARGAFRSLYSRVYRFGISWLLQLPVNDLHSVHVYSVEALLSSRLTQKGYLYGIEALAAADISPDDLSETEVALAPDRDRENRSLHFSTFRDLLSALAHLRRRILPGLNHPRLLACLGAYSFVWVLICLQFSEAPHLQALVFKGEGAYWTYMAATLAALPAVLLLPLTFGLLLLSFIDRDINVQRPTGDQTLLSAIAGAAMLIPLGMALGIVDGLQLPLLLFICLVIVWVGLLRHPGTVQTLIDCALIQSARRHPAVLLTRVLLLCALLFVLSGQALPVDVWMTDVMQIYYSFLDRVKAAGNFSIDPSAPDLSNFLIGRGNGSHLIFATMFHPYIGGLISFAYLCGILVIVRRTGELLMDGILGRAVDPKQAAWTAALNLLALATLTSSLLRIEFAKYHLQFGFFFAAGLYLVVLQLHRGANPGSKGALLTAAAVAATAPLILPQHVVFAAILIGATAITGLLYRNWRMVVASLGLGILAIGACLVSLTLNYAFVGIPELFPTSFFSMFVDADLFRRFSSFEVWRYIYLAQNLNDQAIEIGPRTAERFARFFESTLVNVVLLGSVELRAWILHWVDYHWRWLASDLGFALTCLVPLMAVTAAAVYRPRTGILAACVGVLLITIPVSYVAGQWPSVFVIAAPTTIYAVIVSRVVAAVAAAIAKPSVSANSHYGSMLFGRSITLALMLILVGVATIYALVPGESIGRMFHAFAPLTAVIVTLCILLCGRHFLSERANATEIAASTVQPQVTNPVQVGISLVVLSVVPGILVGLPAARLGIATHFAVLAIAVHVLILLLASADLYRLLHPVPGVYKGLSFKRWAALDMRFVGWVTTGAMALFALSSAWNERSSFAHIASQIVDGPQQPAHTWDFERCIEMAHLAKGSRILPVNSTEQAIPCYAPIGLPFGTFVHHYNSLLAPHYSLTLFGSPSEIESFYRDHDINYFYFDLQERGYVWGHGFSSLFAPDSLLARFDVAYEGKDYYLLTWRGQGLRPVDSKIVDELERLQPIKVRNWPLAAVAFEALKQTLRERFKVSAH